MMAPGWKDRIIHKTRNDGVNLLGRDEQWFLETCERVSPDIIILSPAYKLMRGDPKEDRDVLALLDVFDRVRVKHNAALLIETHAPHGVFNARDMRPFGSSVWLRWPEVGFGLQRDTSIPEGATTRRPEYLESVDWRGAREYRDWPEQIRYGSRNEAPWVPTDPDWRPSVDLGYSITEDAA
jgi:replicative DNA helicase